MERLRPVYRHRWLVGWVAFLVLNPVASVLAQPGTVDLRLEPSNASPLYFRSDQGTLEGLGARPFPGNPPWWVVDYEGTFVGYVESKAVRKGQTVDPGTAIRLKPEPTAAILQTAGSDTKVTVIASSRGWTTVYFEGMAPVYFLPETTRVANAAAAVAATSPAATSRPVSEAPVTSPTASSAETSPRVAAAPTEPEPERSTVRVSTVAPPARTVSSEGPLGSRIFAGTIRRANPFERAFQPSQSLMLENDAGATIAYLDLSQAQRSGPIEGFVGRRVIVFGEAEAATGSAPLLIRARTISTRMP